MGAFPQTQQAPPQIADIPLSLFGGMHTGVAPSDLPEGLSPDNQDWAFVPGEGFSRPALSAIYAQSAGPVGAVYCKTYVQPNGDPLTLWMDVTGQLYVEDVENNAGNYQSIASVQAGVFPFSASAFGREYIAFSDLLSGQWCPLSYDGTYLDRVTQDGPGQPPTCQNSAPPGATIAGAGSGSSYTVATATGSNPQNFGGYTIWTTLTIVTTAPNGLAAGEIVNLSGLGAGISYYSYPTSPQVLQIINGTTFTIAWNAQTAFGVPAPTATGGTVQVEAPSIVRASNIATATTSAAHGFKVGWQVQISGEANTDIGGGISAISRDGNGNVTVTTTNPHGLPIGAQIYISGVTPTITNGTEFNGQFAVASVPTPTTFLYSQGGPADTGMLSSAQVADVWNITAFIQSIPSTTTFTYQDIGPNNFTNGGGVATIIGQISPGAHQFVLIYLDRQGGLTRCSPPVTFYANGGQQVLLSNLCIGNSSIVARAIGCTGAGGDNFFVIPVTPQVGQQLVGTSTVVEDNISTSVILDFNDNTLFDSIAIDQIGNDLFDQRTLAAPIGFFSYASRLICWQDYSKIENLLNMTMAGGNYPVTQSGYPASVSQSGGGTAWTNPSNIETVGTFADANLLANASSQFLAGTGLGFTAEIPLQIVLNLAYYWTGGADNGFGGAYPAITIQLLKANNPVGTGQTIILDPNIARFRLAQRGSASAPLGVTLSFPVTGLASTDISNAGFGFQISASCGGTAADIFVNATLNVTGIGSFPPGWSTFGSTSVLGQVVNSTFPGMYQQYQMTGSDGTNDCMISQGAYQDDSGTFILSPNTQYEARVFVTAGFIIRGFLVVDFFSPTLGQLALAALDMSGGFVNRGFAILSFSAQTPAVIPPDVLLRVYLQGVPTGIVTIGELSIIFSQQPQTNNVGFVSYPLNPEGFAETTGVLGSADDPSKIQCFSVQRNASLLKTASGTHVFQDNDSEPDQWVVNNLSRSVGTCSIRGGDPGQFGTGDAAEDWDLTANQNGLYLFSGGNFWKISQELQKGDPGTTLPTWDAIDWTRQQLVSVKNDPKNHRAYVIAPQVNAPNLLFVLDYRELDTAADLASAPGLKIGITGKMLSTDKCRKWTRWNIPANCMDILVRPGNDKEMTFAGGTNAAGTAFGNLYILDSQQYTDDDYGQIFPYYNTFFFVNHELEQVFNTGSHRKLLRKICGYITGIGYVLIIPFVDSLHNPLPATSPRLLLADTDPSNLQAEDLEWTTMVRGERISLQVSVEPFPGSMDVQLRCQKLVVGMMKDPVVAHRSSDL